MADYSRDPRSSTDAETAPLLRGGSDIGNTRRANSDEPSTLRQRANAIAHEPFTPLAQILLILCLALLLLSSVFIGLFAGAQHKLHTQKPEPTTTTEIRSRTVTFTKTSEHEYTTTATITTTASLPPVPVPTSPPHEKACLEPHCIVLAASILSGVDVTQDPCENFYDFANGGDRKSVV